MTQKLLPLVFQWISKKYDASVPNSEKYDYSDRITLWAIREPDREIILTINSNDFKIRAN